MNVNFTVFIDKILSGEKRQTIRRAGKKWANVKAGDRLTLYTGLRTKNCRKLGEAEVDSIDDIEMYIFKLEDGVRMYGVELNRQGLPAAEVFPLARADGFENIVRFLDFFQDRYGEHFEGKIIKWKNFKAVEAQKPKKSDFVLKEVNKAMSEFLGLIFN